MSEPGESTPNRAQIVTVRQTTSETEAWRREKLLETIELPPHHDVFGLEDGERGETDLVRMEIDTGDASPRKQPPRRMPFAVRQELARQLMSMYQNRVIQPSCLPWSSPVVMVRKEDGSHRLCVDYRGFNAVTKIDTFPLLRIDDLLNQLGKARYFSTLDLASGFWQIQMEPLSQKMAFVTPQGLFEFRVMPFKCTRRFPAAHATSTRRVEPGRG